VQGLMDLGHDVNQTMPPIGGAQAILENSDGFLVAGSDPRKDGCAIGY
jgi:gamma-glutamyltranspeptidase/glutathione hydrolase